MHETDALRRQGGKAKLTLTTRFLASGEMFSGTRRSTFEILRYVAATPVGSAKPLERVEREKEPTLVSCLILKRRVSDDELIGQHTKRPQVDMMRVMFAFDHFWRKVVERAAERPSAVRWRVHAPPKISNLELAVDAKEDVLGLDVAVDDVFAVEVMQCVGHLGNVLCREHKGCVCVWSAELMGACLRIIMLDTHPRCSLLAEAAQLDELAVELALAGKLEHDKDALVIMKVAIHAQNVRMPDSPPASVAKLY